MAISKYEDPGISDEKISYIARELAMDILDLSNILHNANVTLSEFERVKRMQRFQRLLQSETEAWSGSLNTHERVRIKAAYNIEDWLLGAHKDMTNAQEPLASRVQVAKLVKELAGMGLQDAAVNGASEKLVVTINLGSDQKLRFEKDVTPQVKEIDGETNS